MVIREITQEKNTVAFRCSFNYDETEIAFYVINADLKTKLFPPILMIMKRKPS